MTSKWQNTSKIDTNAIKFAENEVLQDFVCWI